MTDKVQPTTRLYVVYLASGATAYIEAEHLLGDEGAIEFYEAGGKLVRRIEAGEYVAWALASHVMSA